MTVTYTHEVANARLSGFSSLLVRWRGSVYKLFYKEFLIFITLYTILTVVYRALLHGESKVYFEKLCLQFQDYTDLIPISFVLGFYVTLIVGRWWSQLEHLPFPDSIMLLIGANVHGNDDRGQVTRRTLMRYINIAQVLMYRCVSTAVYKRFPTMEHVVAAGIMTKSEHSTYENVKTENLKYWVPFMWFTNLLSKLRQEGRIYDDMTYKVILEELNKYRVHCGSLVNYDWVSVPLVYTQVVTVAVYMFFVSTLLSRQYLDPDMNYSGHEVDLYVPIFTICQFFFYMGWLKVAEQLINPFGEDDDDFEVNWCIDRNLEISMLAVDQMYSKHPKLERDLYWGIPNPDVPYTAASANHKVDPFMGSTFDMRLAKEDVQIPENRMERLVEQSDLMQQTNDDKSKLISKNASTNNKFDNLRLLRRRFQFDSDTTPLMTPIIKPTSEQSPSDSSEDEAGSMTSPEIGRDDDQSAKEDIVTSESEDEPANKESETDEQKLILSEKSVDISSMQNSDKQVVNNELQKEEATVEPEKKQPVRDERKVNALPNTTTHNKPRKIPKKRVPPLPGAKVGAAQKHVLKPPAIHRVPADSDRENAQKRIYLAAKRKRSKNFVPPHRRQQQRRGYNNKIWLGPSRLFRDSIASPDTGSMFSETDVASNPANDSPFGSLMSFGTSIPSPKQLRWAFRSRTRNLDGEVTSLTSSMPSPSGNEGGGTDIMPSLSRPPLLELPAYPAVVTEHIESRRAAFQTNSNVAAAEIEPMMPFTDNLRRRLQVLPNPGSPAAGSPLANRVWDTRPVMENSNLLMIAEESVRPSLDTGKRKEATKLPPTSTNTIGIRQHLIDLTSKIEPKKKIANLKSESGNSSSSSGDKPRGKRARNPNEGPEVDVRGLRRNSNSFWSVIKTWKNKRKERKPSDDQQKFMAENSAVTAGPPLGLFVKRSLSKSEEGLCGRKTSSITTPFDSMVTWENEMNSSFHKFKPGIARPSFLPIHPFTDSNNNKEPATYDGYPLTTQLFLQPSKSESCLDSKSVSAQPSPNAMTDISLKTQDVDTKVGVHYCEACRDELKCVKSKEETEDQLIIIDNQNLEVVENKEKESVADNIIQNNEQEQDLLQLSSDEKSEKDDVDSSLFSEKESVNWEIGSNELVLKSNNSSCILST
ncbi:uncharacterized protein LOC100175557 [Ciona intestinalis]